MESFVQPNGTRIYYTIERRKRKTVGISISAEKGVIIAAPKWVSKAQLHNLVEERAAWIESKLELVLKKKKAAINYSFDDGDSLPYQGTMYKLELLHSVYIKKPSVDLTQDSITVSIPQELISTGSPKDAVRNLLIDWYKKQALKVICKRITFYGKMMGVTPSKVAVRDQKTIWGSCSGKNSININWKLILAPAQVLDYVLVHELAHIKQKNHSKAFWSLVECAIPEYKALSFWLKQNNEKLMI